MDKLKPILAQRFWILSALCLILPLTGWWISTSTMATEITTRKDVIKKAFESIPVPGPNKNWTDKVVALNNEEEQKVTQTGDYLWNNQTALMTWPEAVRPRIEEAVKVGGFRTEIDAKTRGDYRYVYDQELTDLINIVSPYNPVDGSGLVEASLEQLIPNLGWGTSPIAPSNKEMWDTQEDIWLYRALFTAIANINTQFQSTSIVDSKIKEITLIELRGGTPGGGAKPAAGAGGAMGGGYSGGGSAMPGAPMPPGGPGGMPSPMAGPTGRGGNQMLGGAAGGAGSLVATFDPAEQFGSDEDSSGGGGAPGGPAMGAPSAAPAPPGGPGGTPPSGPGGPMAAYASKGGVGGGSANVARKRYIEETPRYKTRGFYMEVVMDHRQLPEFISELSDSGWPLRVIRVQAVDRDLSDVGGGVVGLGAGGMSSPGMGGRGGMMPGGRGGVMPGGRGGVMPPSMMSGPRPSRGDDDLPTRSTTRPTMPKVGIAAGEAGMTGEGAVDLQVAMSDPYLVNVALSGVITLYLPPPVPGATPGAPGAPTINTTTPAAAPVAAPPATTPPAAGAPAAAAPAAPAATVPAGTPATAPAATPPATGTPPAAATPAATATPPAAGATPPATAPEAAPAAPPAANPTPPAAATPDPKAPAAEPATPAPPAGTPAKPAGTK